MIDDLKKDMAVRIDHLVKMRAEGFNLLAGKLGALSPLAILGRGYSITMKIPGGGIMRDSMDLKAGDRVETRLGRGKFISRVEET
jgi:exodeoxyribonuclease VII large subunit